jgi:hypothetical protein
VDKFDGCQGCYYYNIRNKCYRLEKLIKDCACKICLIKGMCSEPCDVLDSAIEIETKYFFGEKNEKTFQ